MVSHLLLQTRLRVFSLFARTKVLQKSQSLTLFGFKPCHCIVYVHPYTALHIPNSLLSVFKVH